MHVLVLPSWYPSSRFPFAGCFTEEQARLFAELYPGSRVTVSVSGSMDHYLSPRRPREWPMALACWACQPDLVVKGKGLNFNELHRRALAWGPFLGGSAGVIRGHRANFLEAERRWGLVDVVHAHVAYPAGEAARRIRREFRVPVVLTEHMSPFPFDHFLFRGQLRSKVRNPLTDADAVVAVSPQQKAAIERFGIPAQVIPNVVDERVFWPMQRPRNAVFRFLSLTNLSEQKNIPGLLRAFLRVLAAGYPCCLWIAGDGPGRPALEALTRELGLAGSVAFLGPVARSLVPKIMGEADALVISSHTESFSVVCAEAQACGIPVVSTRCGGPEWVVHPEAGLLVAPDDVEALRDGMLHVLANPGKFYPWMIRSQFMARFSRAVVLGQLHDLYQELSTWMPAMRVRHYGLNTSHKED